MKNGPLVLKVITKGAKRIPMSVAFAFALALPHQDATANPIIIPAGATLINGGDTSSEADWQTGGPAALGKGTALEGTILAESSIPADPAAMDLHGLGLAQRGEGILPGQGDPSGGDPVPDADGALPMLGS